MSQRRRIALALVLVSAGYLALVSLFTLRTGAWENNDEADHVLYAEHILVHHQPPPIAAGHGVEAHQAPLYYYLVAGWQKVNGIAPFTPQLVGPPEPAPPADKRILILSHDYNASQRVQAHSLHLLRLVSVLCGLLTVAAAFATGWLLTRRVGVAAAVAAAVATWPKFLVISAAVTNSVLVDALCAVAVPCLLLWFRFRSPIWAVVTGAVLGLAVLAQVTALPVVGLLLLAVGVIALKRRDWQSPLLVGATCAAVCGGWFVHNLLAYGDPMATTATNSYLIQAFGPHLIRQPAVLSGAVFKHSFAILHGSTWYDGGWNQLLLPHWVDGVIWVLAGVTLAAAVWFRMAGRFVLVLSALGSAAGWLLIIRQTTQAEGRYLLVAVTSWATLLVLGSARLVPWRSAGLWLWPAVFLGLDAYVMTTWLIPYGTT